MHMTELHQKSDQELRGMLGELREKLRRLRFERAANRLKNVQELSRVRQDIARVLTGLRQHRGRA